MSNKEEIWQACNELGEFVGPATKDEVAKGLLHAAVHLCLWRKSESNVEVLLQKRSPNVKTWPGLYDLAATGHINYGEMVLAAVGRELDEEVGLNIAPADLFLLFVYHQHDLVSPNGFIENEFQWVFGAQISVDQSLEFKDGEVSSAEWVSLEEFRSLMGSSKFAPTEETYAATMLKELAYHTDENH